MNGWIYIATVAVVLWVLWLFLGYVLDVLDIYFDHYRAARHKLEAVPPNKERERSS